MNLIIKLIRSGSVRATRFRPDPGRTGPPGSDRPSRARPSRSGPSRAEPNGAEPGRAEPNVDEPGRSSRSCRAGPFINCNGPGRNEAEAGRAGPSRRPGLAAGSSRSEAGQDRTGSCPTRLGPAQLGPARLRPAQLGSNRLGSVRLVSARLGSRRWGVSRANNASDTVDSATPWPRHCWHAKRPSEGEGEGEGEGPPAVSVRPPPLRTLDLLSHLTVQNHLKLVLFLNPWPHFYLFLFHSSLDSFRVLGCVSSTVLLFCFLEKMVVSG
ncbi:hypothetical protein MUK42_07912 [Musa troglodytarum]|uniref:Uncharacterized protein n=1 Tax=Musa troglodytarum TaxID=320322 RepID=A0A9E7GBX0_9LILI|nr:hypothetical protein MUK42_07912 [Musa troglodytarum]